MTNCIVCVDRLDRNALRLTLTFTTSLGRDVTVDAAVCSRCAHTVSTPLAHVLELARHRHERQEGATT